MKAHGGYRIVAVVDPHLDRAKAAARAVSRDCQAVSWQQADDALAEVDAVTCGAPPFVHYEVVGRALAAGRHVLTEKPFVMSLEEGEDLVRQASNAGLVLGIVHNFQFANSVRRVQRWLGEGRLGQLRMIRAIQLSNPRRRLPVWADDLPLGLFYDESPHLLYLVRLFAGRQLEMVSVAAHASTIGLANTPAQLDVYLRSEAIPASLHFNFEAPVSEWHVIIAGDQGLAAVDVFRDIAVFTPNDGEHASRQVLKTTAALTRSHWRGYFRSGWGHVRGTLMYGNDEVFRRFHDSATTGKPLSAIGAQDALDVLRLQHSIIERSRPYLDGAGVVAN